MVGKWHGVTYLILAVAAKLTRLEKDLRDRFVKSL